MRTGGKQFGVRFRHACPLCGGCNQLICGPIAGLLLSSLHQRPCGPFDSKYTHINKSGCLQLRGEFLSPVEIGQGKSAHAVVYGRLKNVGDGIGDWLRVEMGVRHAAWIPVPPPPTSSTRAGAGGRNRRRSRTALRAGPVRESTWPQYRAYRWTSPVCEVEETMAVLKYEEIAESLRARIAAGEFAPDQTIPSGRDLAEQWCVSRATAIKAVDVLRNDGVVVARQGTGFVVTETPAARAPVGPGRRASSAGCLSCGSGCPTGSTARARRRGVGSAARRTGSSARPGPPTPRWEGP